MVQQSCFSPKLALKIDMKIKLMPQLWSLMHLKGVFVPVLYQKDSVPGATAVTALMIKPLLASCSSLSCLPMPYHWPLAFPPNCFFPGILLRVCAKVTLMMIPA